MSIAKWMGGMVIVASLGLVGCGGDEPKPEMKPAADTMKEGATKAADAVKEGAEKV